MISAEGPPLLRAGALVDVMDALPAALRARGHDVAVALPFYREIRKNPVFHAEETGITVEVRVGDKAAARVAFSFSLSDVTNSSIGREFTASTAVATKTMPPASFFLVRRRWNWRAA